MQADGAAGEGDEVVAAAEKLEDAGEEAAFGGRIAIHDHPRGGTGDWARLVGSAGFNDFLGGAHGDPAEEGGVGVGVGELGAEIGTEAAGGEGPGGGGQVEEVGEDFVGRAVKARREPLGGGVHGAANGDGCQVRRQTGADGRGEDAAQEGGGFATAGGRPEPEFWLKTARKNAGVARLEWRLWARRFSGRGDEREPERRRGGR